MEKYNGGADIHQDVNYFVILDGKGNVYREQGVPFNKEATQNFLTGIPSSSLRIAIEACGLWRGAYKLLTELGYEVVLVNPVRVHNLSFNQKTDKVDARTLATLLHIGSVPRVFIPDEDTLKQRDLARHRARLARDRASLMRKIKSFLLLNGTPYRGRWTLKDLEMLKGVDPKVACLVRLIESYNTEINLLRREIGRVSRNGRLTSLLQTVPGIGEFSSLMIVAEIADIKRFKNPKSLVSYAGLCPGVHQSASKSHPVPKKACNKWLKWIMTECSGRAATMDCRYMRHFYRVKKRKGFKTARRSVARKMLTDVWHILAKEEPYRDHGPSSEGQEHPQRITRR